jgi:hypothetical protein
MTSLLAAEASAAPTPCADLQITGVTIAPTAPSQTTLISGQPAKIEVGVKNAGSCAAGGFVVRFMTTKNSFTVVSGSIASLGVGKSTTLTLAYSFPKAGNFDTEVQLNPKREVPETNYANDIALKAITVVAASAKFVITHFSIASVDPTNAVVAGRPAVATVTVENVGNVAAGAFKVKWTPLTFATSLTQSVSAGLAPGKSETVQLSYTYTSSGTETATAAVVASGGTIALASSTLETVVEPQLANLRIVRVLAPSEGFATRSSTQQVEIENDGNAAAGHFIVQWSPGTGQTLQQQQVNGLAEGAKTILTFSYVYPKPGTYEGLITLDPTKLVKELFTTEKTAKTLLVIAEGTVDLTVTSVHVEAIAPGPVIQETPTLVTVKVRNQGNVESPSFVTQWNPDSLGISGSGTQSVTEETGPLAPETERTITFVFTYPKPGNYRGVAEVNPKRVVKESNYANNTQFVEVGVEPLPIALDFSTGIEVSSANISADAGRLYPGEEATESFTVKNSGPIATGPFEVQFQTEAGGVKQTRTIAGLNPGESQLESFKVTYSKPGTYALTAILDPSEQVDKVVNGFKPIEETSTVTVEAINLNFVSGIEISGSREFNTKGVLFPGEEPTAEVAIQDKSPVPTGAFAVQFESEQGGFKQTVFVEKLNAGEQKTVTFKLRYSKPGSYLMTAILDPFKAVDTQASGFGPIETSRGVTVDEKEATVFVEAPTLEVKASPDPFWFINLFVYEPGASCLAERDSVKGENIFKLIHNEAPLPGTSECPRAFENVGGTGRIGPFPSLANEVHLKEDQPLRASVHVETYPEEFEYVLFGSPAGSATVEKTREQYVELPSHPYNNEEVGGLGCKQSNGNENPEECFASFFSLFLENEAGPAFTPMHALARSATVTKHASARVSRKAAAARSQGEEPGGTVAEKQAAAERELAAHEAEERATAETETKAAEASERTKAIAAEQAAIAAIQELNTEVAQKNREQRAASGGGTQ